MAKGLFMDTKPIKITFGMNRMANVPAEANQLKHNITSFIG